MSLDNRTYYMLKEIGGQKIHAGHHAGIASGRLFFDCGKALYSLELSAIRKKDVSLDKARQEKLPQTKILGLMADGVNMFALLYNGKSADLYSYSGEEWKKNGVAEITSSVTSAAFNGGFFFCETNPKKTLKVYYWTKEKGLETAAIIDEPLKIYSLVIKKGKLRLSVSGSASRVLEIDLSKIGNEIRGIKDFKSINLPFSFFKEVEFPSGKSLFSIDGGTRIVDEGGNIIWTDANPGKSGKQIAAAAILDNRFGVIGSWRRDKTYPAACLYIFDGNNPIYIRSIISDNPESLRWTGYETSQSGLSGDELFIPCYDGDFMHLKRLSDGETRIGATILAEGPDYVILGKLNEKSADETPEAKTVEVKLYKNPPKELGAVWRGQNSYPDYGVDKAFVYLTFDVEQHLPGKPYCITGADLPSSPGVYWILDNLKKNGLIGTFFVNIYEFENFDHDFMNKLLKDIDDSGCEVGLHCHTSMKIDTALDFNKIPLGELSIKEQLKILEYGTEFIRNAIGKNPVSFRSGAYSINNETLNVLEELGYKVDSSVFISNINAQPDCKYFTKNKPSWHGKLLELPVTSLRWDGRPFKLDINWLGSCQAMLDALALCRDAGLDQLVTMAHSFSFLNFTKNPASSIVNFKFTSNRYISGINEHLKKEFMLFLKELSNSPNYKVHALRDAPTLVFENERLDIIPEYHSKAENTFLCPICGYQGDFIPYRGRPNAQCPSCRSLERMRLKNLYLKKFVKVQDGHKLSILHAGPHMVTSAWLKSMPNIDYISSDPYNEADFHFPLENIPFSDSTFDLTIAFAVFQHLLDDDKAIDEIFRVLKPGGKLLLWVGKIKSKITTEMYDRDKFKDMIPSDFSSPVNINDSKLTEKNGKYYYNPRNATRIYGSDILDKLADKSFHVECLEAKNIINEPSLYGIDDDDLILVCTKFI